MKNYNSVKLRTVTSDATLGVCSNGQGEILQLSYFQTVARITLAVRAIS
jgi:hypothetical protein